MLLGASSWPGRDCALVPQMGEDAPMSAATAELSSMATALEELGRRVESAAAAYKRDKREDLAGELYEAERAISTAVRRLVRVTGAKGA